MSLFEQFLPPGPAKGTAADHVVARVLAVGFEWKAFTLFSLLFGIGLAAQYERTRARGVVFGTYVARRLGFLLALGLAHLFLVWNGDVLALYAVIGIVAAPPLRLPVRVLLVLALAMLVVHVLPLPYPTPFPSLEALVAHVSEAKRVYGFGSFGEALAFRSARCAPSPRSSSGRCRGRSASSCSARARGGPACSAASDRPSCAWSPLSACSAVAASCGQ